VAELPSIFFRIASNSGDAALEIDGAVARLTRRGVEATVTVHELERGGTMGGVGKFFAGLASGWRGWEGDRSWASLESELELTARHDGRGTIELIVQLGQPLVEAGWFVRASLFLDAGSLDDVSSRAISARDGSGGK
jgi:hypothetical protein